jgi:NADP-dependent 3-hydroxy acid dehydrogenase YdfG
LASVDVHRPGRGCRRRRAGPDGRDQRPGQLYTASASLPHLLNAAEQEPRRAADLINVGSVGRRQPHAINAVYGLTKAGLAAFTESLRQEVTKRHVRVGVLEPALATELASHNRPENLENVLAPYFREIETLTPEDIADATAFMITRLRRAAVFDL